MVHYFLNFVKKNEGSDVFNLMIRTYERIDKHVENVQWNFYEASGRTMLAVWKDDDKEKKILYLLPVACTTIDLNIKQNG